MRQVDKLCVHVLICRKVLLIELLQITVQFFILILIKNNSKMIFIINLKIFPPKLIWVYIVYILCLKCDAKCDAKIFMHFIRKLIHLFLVKRILPNFKLDGFMTTLRCHIFGLYQKILFFEEIYRSWRLTQYIFVNLSYNIILYINMQKVMYITEPKVLFNYKYVKTYELIMKMYA